MAQTQYCEAGCGREYDVEIGTRGEPVHDFYCWEHAIAWFLAALNTMEQAQAAAEGIEPGTEAEGRAALEGRRPRRRVRPRPVALDKSGGPVVEDAPEAGAQAAAEE